MFLFIFETERDRAWAGEGQRDRETQNPKQAPGSKLSAQSPTQGQTHKLGDHDLSWSQTFNRLSHPGVPVCILFNVTHFKWPWGAWVAQSVERPTSAQVMISQFVSSSPTSGSGLTAQSLEPASDSVSPCLSALPLLTPCLSHSQKWINIIFFFNLKKRKGW